MTIDENVEEMLTEFPDEPLHKLREYAKKGYVLYKINLILQQIKNKRLQKFQFAQKQKF